MRIRFELVWWSGFGGVVWWSGLVEWFGLLLRANGCVLVVG